MKSVLALASLLAAGAFAQVSVVTDAFSAISAATTKLDGDITAYSGGSVAGLQSDATALIAAINAGNTAVSAISELSTDDAVGLVGPIGDLAKVVDSAINDAISAKATFDAANEGYAILTNLQSISDATNTFSATVISKVPASLKSTAQSLAQPINADLARGIAAYKDEKAPSGGATTTGKATATGKPTDTKTRPAHGATTTDTLTTTTRPAAVGTITPIPLPANTTVPLMPFNGAGVPTAAAAYGVIVLAAMGAVML